MKAKPTCTMTCTKQSPGHKIAVSRLQAMFITRLRSQETIDALKKVIMRVGLMEKTLGPSGTQESFIRLRPEFI